MVITRLPSLLGARAAVLTQAGHQPVRGSSSRSSGSGVICVAAASGAHAGLLVLNFRKQCRCCAGYYGSSVHFMHKPRPRIWSVPTIRRQATTLGDAVRVFGGETV